MPFILIGLISAVLVGWLSMAIMQWSFAGLAIWLLINAFKPKPNYNAIEHRASSPFYLSPYVQPQKSATEITYTSPSGHCFSYRRVKEIQ
jgi:hypothetical protein